MAIKKPTPPPKPAPISKGPYEKRGGIPRGKLPGFIRQGPPSIPWSRQRSFVQRKALGEELLKRFPPYYGSDLSRSEIDREIRKLKIDLSRAKTAAEQNKFREMITRLEESKKRAGL
jgi:hypothetical protein